MTIRNVPPSCPSAIQDVGCIKSVPTVSLCYLVRVNTVIRPYYIITVISETGPLILSSTTSTGGGRGEGGEQSNHQH